MKLFKYILILTLSIGILNSCKKDEVDKTENPEVATTYGITGIPLMLLLNPEGKILTITNKVDDIEAQVEKVY
jgi:hypothetical protein